MQSVGSRAEVWHGNALHTSGGLKKSALKMNKHGRIVSKKRSAAIKKNPVMMKIARDAKSGKHLGFLRSMKQ